MRYVTAAGATVTLRPAISQDAAAVARLFRAVREANLPYLPDLYTPDQDLAFFRDRVFVECTVWVAGEAAIAGFCAWRPGWVDHLYVQSDCHGRGIGTALLSRAMAENTVLRLWAFQRNARALRFYAARGFRIIEQTDGSRNEEREPDALLEWVRA
jgi:putative acetyltransferase